MHFGDKLRQLRKQKDWTQPQLAEAIGIEQSYLSKLENGKSVPSADIFQLIVKVFGIDIEMLLDGIEQSVVHRQLRQIPEVSNFLSANQLADSKKRKNWLLLSALSITSGAVLLVSSHFGLLFSDVQYNYKSRGIVLADESKEIFSNFKQNFHLLKREQQKEISKQMNARLDEKYLLSSSYRGDIFNIAVHGGSRTYGITGHTKEPRVENRYLSVIGLLLFLLGIFGFVLEKKIARLG